MPQPCAAGCPGWGLVIGVRVRPCLHKRDPYKDKKLAVINRALRRCSARQAVFYADEADMELNPRIGYDRVRRTYFMLTDVEAVLRSLKFELGLRLIYHHKPIHAEGHLFITVIAYQLVQVGPRPPAANR